MKKGTNKPGLQRQIQPNIRRRVRQNSGFGCVICGKGIIDYEHVDPAFKNAKTHDPNAIALLCAGCHDKVTRGFWSKDKVKAALANPRCKTILELSDPFAARHV